MYRYDDAKEGFDHDLLQIKVTLGIDSYKRRRSRQFISTFISRHPDSSRKAKHAKPAKPGPARQSVETQKPPPTRIKTTVEGHLVL